MRIIPPSPRILNTLRSSGLAHGFTDLDYETVGYFLSCHLIIEYCIDECLTRLHPQVDWKARRADFPFKVNLISTSLKLRNVAQTKKFVDALKHLNTLRNSLAHKLDFRLTVKEMQPLVLFAETMAVEKVWKKTPNDIIHVFTFYATYELEEHLKSIK